MKGLVFDLDSFAVHDGPGIRLAVYLKGWTLSHDGKIPSTEALTEMVQDYRVPDLSSQRVLFDILRPEDIGITLTDGDMMDPEASVSALVFHHPAAAYFSVSPGIGSSEFASS